jgi:deazaflavin-dependent oxidoreductase (nitroreductase family)
MARAVRLLTRPRAITTRFTRLHAALLRASRGRLRRSRLLGGGQPVLSLTTTGRRSGEPRSTIVAYLEDGDAYVVFGANLGGERDPAWCLNLAADPSATIHVNGHRLDVGATRATGDEAKRLWRAYAERLPAVDTFAAIAGREIPVWILGQAKSRSG